MVADIALGYVIGKFVYEFLRNSTKKDPMVDFLNELHKAKKEAKEKPTT